MKFIYENGIILFRCAYARLVLFHNIVKIFCTTVMLQCFSQIKYENMKFDHNKSFEGMNYTIGYDMQYHKQNDFWEILYVFIRHLSLCQFIGPSALL